MSVGRKGRFFPDRINIFFFFFFPHAVSLCGRGSGHTQLRGMMFMFSTISAESSYQLRRKFMHQVFSSPRNTKNGERKFSPRKNTAFKKDQDQDFFCFAEDLFYFLVPGLPSPFTLVISLSPHSNIIVCTYYMQLSVPPPHPFQLSRGS